MSGAFGTPPPSQVALDTYSANAKLVELANVAVWEALRAVAESNDPIGPLLFGIDRETLQAIGSTPKSKMVSILQTGVPIFSIRLAAAEAVSVMTSAAGHNAAKVFGQLLSTFGDGMRLKHLSSKPQDATPSPSDVTVDMQSTNAKLIEKANIAIWDAVCAAAQSADPLASVLFGVTDETLQAFYEYPRSKVLAIFQTGVPVWAIRISSAASVVELTSAGGYNTESLFSQLLKTFGDTLPLKRS